MIKTNHYRSRIQQRGVLQSTVDLAIAYGSKRGDKFILGKKQLRVVKKGGGAKIGKPTVKAKKPMMGHKKPKMGHKKK